MSVAEVPGLSAEALFEVMPGAGFEYAGGSELCRPGPVLDMRAGTINEETISAGVVEKAVGDASAETVTTVETLHGVVTTAVAVEDMTLRSVDERTVEVMSVLVIFASVADVGDATVGATTDVDLMASASRVGPGTV